MGCSTIYINFNTVFKKSIFEDSTPQPNSISATYQYNSLPPMLVFSPTWSFKNESDISKGNRIYWSQDQQRNKR